MLPNLLLIFIGEDSIVASFLKKSVFLVLCLSLLIIPLSFLKPKYYSWIILLIFPLILFEISTIGHFKAPSSEEIIASIFLTNYYEVSELIRGNFLSSLIALILFLITVFISIKIKQSFKLSKNIKKLILISCLSFFTVLYIRNYIVSLTFKDNFKERLGATNYAIDVQLNKTFPVDVFLKLGKAYKGIKRKKRYKENIKDYKFGAIKNDTIKKQEIYVLVIGETSRKHNFSLYGYHKKTTPNLDEISNIIAFRNVKSAANVTSLSIPFMVTRATPSNLNPKFNEPAILNGFKEAGFKTYWLSNQAIGVGSVFGFYSSLADVYKNTSASLDVANYDEKLFPELKNVLEDSTSSKKFIVIHLLGSHFRYNYRYPKQFNFFNPSMSKGLSIQNSSSISKKNELINSYDNSILYTDYVINNFINQLKQQNAVSYLYYISDHGENLYDDDRNKLLHGFNKPTKYEIDIPLVIWLSKKYKNQYKEKAFQLLFNKNSQISTVNTFHTLLNMSNIKYRTEDLKQSFANKMFDSIQSRYFYTADKNIIKLDK
ncbi:glucan phosphoethanolaminetransferase (alkaline phosphatase superfamily) [Lutibacter sp. Hel_I_33_5]|nr:glucan phosphoethanolaminetransferase (alkaline phosphatase superfamily) [Lutibacter sp. Hel_I_33_5]